MSDSTARPLRSPATIMAAAADRTDPMQSTAPAVDGSASAAWMVLALVLSRYGGAVVAKATMSGDDDGGAHANAQRAASTPIDVVSSS